MSRFVEQIEARLRADPEPLSPKTIDSYLSALNSLIDIDMKYRQARVAPGKHIGRRLSPRFLENPSIFIEKWKETMKPVSLAQRVFATIGMMLHGIDPEVHPWQPAAVEKWRKASIPVREAKEYDVPKRGEMSEKQEKNWLEDLSWIDGALDGLKREVDALDGRGKPLSQKDWQKVYQYILLSLEWLLKAPRRNGDWLEMYVRRDMPDEEEDSKQQNYNWLVLDEKRPVFIFNHHKSRKRMGRYVEEIPDSLMDAIETYLKWRPGRKSGYYPFLVDYTGSPQTDSGSITRALNNVFAPIGKKISTQMLRVLHASKHGEAFKEADEIAEAMGHSSGVHAGTYVKYKKPSSGEGDDE